MAAGGGRSMEETATWAVAVVCFVLVLISIAIEQGIHRIGSWLKKKHKTAQHEALEKIKAELMLMGFISLLLTVLQKPISEICISSGVADSWHPCVSLDDGQKPKIYEDKYCANGKAPLMSTDAIHELHIFIFVLAFLHVLYCITTLALGKLKMRRWKTWEDETKSVEYQFSNDPERIRFTRETSFGRRHMTFWSRSTTFVWIVCFFRQFFKSVTRVDYLTLRQGFIAAHLAPGSDKSFDFRKYISRSLDEDFKVVVGISPIMWLFATLFLLGYTNGWYSYYWLPFMPLIIILLVGTKLQLIITELGLRISERADVVKGTIVVHPDDDLFWFSRPRFLLFLIHFVLFQNAFQLAFFVFTWYKYGFRSCFHHKIQDVIIRLAMGLMIHILCSYITLPLYALVTQMGSTMKPTVFSARVAQAIKSWHRSIRNKKSHHYDRGTTPIMADSSWDDDSATPSVGSSPMHLLHGNVNRSESLEVPPSSPPPFSEKNFWQFRNNGQGGFGYHDDPYSIDVVVSSPPPDIQLGRMEMEPRVSPVQLPSSRLVGDSSWMGQPEAPQDQ